METVDMLEADEIIVEQQIMITRFCQTYPSIVKSMTHLAFHIVAYTEKPS